MQKKERKKGEKTYKHAASIIQCIVVNVESSKREKIVLQIKTYSIRCILNLLKPPIIQIITKHMRTKRGYTAK